MAAAGVVNNDDDVIVIPEPPQKAPRNRYLGASCKGNSDEPASTSAMTSSASTTSPAASSTTSSVTPQFSESQLPEEYWTGDQHPEECGCHWCHLLHGNVEWDDAKFMAELEAKWRAEAEELFGESLQ